MPTRLRLFSRPGCHLCDDARAVLDRVGEPYEDVDIDADDELFKRYLERIPVVTLDGEELFEFFADEAVLRARLREPRVH
jgi:glutaredoxin